MKRQRDFWESIGECGPLIFFGILALAVLGFSWGRYPHAYKPHQIIWIDGSGREERIEGAPFGHEHFPWYRGGFPGQMGIGTDDYGWRNEWGEIESVKSERVRVELVEEG